MPLRLDENAKTISLSVADFISEDEYYRIGFDRGDGLRRLWVGQAIHSRYQDQRMGEEATYKREVPFRYEFTTGGWEVRLLGRLDGIFREPSGRYVIEEVKSANFALDGDPLTTGNSKLERARKQLLVYCHAIAHQGGPTPPESPGPRRLAEVTGQLVFVDIATSAVRRLPVGYDPAQMQEWFAERIAALVTAAVALREDAMRRRLAGKNLAFPHASTRAGQDLFLEQTARSLAAREFLVASAPTGIGKTAAALHPALKAALETNRRLFILTAKTLQQPLALETLSRMQPGNWHAVRLRAKEKMCANDEVICHEEFCRFAKDYPEKMEGSGLVPRLLENHAILDPDLIYDEAVKCEVCPFEVSLELASRSEAVVADYNYIFDPDVALRETREPEGLARTFIVVDEAHNLVDRGRAIYSPELTSSALAAARDFCLARRSTELFEHLATALSDLDHMMTGIADGALGFGGAGEARALIPTEELEHFRERFEALVAEYFAWKRQTLSYVEEDPILRVFFDLVHVARLLPEIGDDLVPVVDRQDGRQRFRLLCLDPSRFLARTWNAAAGGILMSATLQPFEFYRQLLGLPDERTSNLSVQSPFPPENRRVLVIPSVSTTFKHRQRDADETARLLADLAGVTPGNVLALFPSYRFLEDIVSRLPDIPQRVLCQRANLDDFERRQLLTSLAEAPEEGVFLAAVSGGLYAEGVDYPGETLRAVFVVSPSLPQVSFEQELLKKFYDERYGHGFDYAYLVPGLRRVIQSAGRVVRSERDRGLVALICRRFAEERYRRHLPPEWFSSSRPESLPPSRAIEAAREFFLEPDERDCQTFPDQSSRPRRTQPNRR